MQTHPQETARQNLAHIISLVELRELPSSLFGTIQQQCQGAHNHLQNWFSNCITHIQRKIQRPNIGPGLALPSIKLGGADWETHFQKTLETVGKHVGHAMKLSKETFAEGLRLESRNANSMWACSSVSSRHFEAKHLFDLAMSAHEVSKRLDGIPVYTVTNTANEFVLVSDMDNQRSLGLFCFRQQDAEALLSQVKGKQSGSGHGMKVIAVSLNKVYELRDQGITFRLLPDPFQVKNALEAASKVGVPGHSFPGVPVFQSDNLVIRSKNKQFRPLFFSKEDLERSLRQAFEQQKKLNPSFEVSTDIQVGSFEDVIHRMENNEDSSTWEDIVFIPPGLDVFSHTRKTT